MKSELAFLMGALNRGKEMMVFDWDKAATLIKESNAQYAYAGLRGDWEWTGGCIFADGKIDTESYTYLSSTWAVPEIEINGNRLDCYKMESEVPEWDAEAKWPQSAKDILDEKH